MPKIFKDNTDQYLLFSAPKSDYSGMFFGTTNGESLSGAVVTISEYKKTDVEIPSPSVTWNDVIGRWKLIIPSAYITQYGPCEINITGLAIAPLSIEIDTVSSVDYMENVLESQFTRAQIDRMVASVLLGSELRSTGTSTFKGLNGSTSRVVATVNASGRTVTTRNGA